MRTSFVLAPMVGIALFPGLHMNDPASVAGSANAAVARAARAEARAARLVPAAQRNRSVGSVAIGDQPCTVDADCLDESDCTIDFCNTPGVCDHLPEVPGTACGDPTDTICNPADACDGAGGCVVLVANDGTPCSDGLFCNGQETCQGGECADRPDPCVDEAHCDEILNRCRACAANEECDDRNACTNNACISGTCVFTGIPGCVTCELDADCSDGDACTTDECIRAVTEEVGRCANTPVVEGTPCDDGFFCNGEATCLVGECTDSPAPCVDLVHCDEEGDVCLECVTHVDCDDGDECTADTCEAAVCVHVVVPGCLPCSTDLDCDDDDACTLDACIAGLCEYTAAPECLPCTSDADCDDGDACTIDECINALCVHTVLPECLACTSDADCDDGNACTFDACLLPGFCSNEPEPPATPCPNDLYCDGEETCDGLGTCVPGTPPCPEDQKCDEDVDRCVPCEIDVPEGKVAVCHIPPGNYANARTIFVDEHAVPAHLAHGDTVGPCPGDCPMTAPVNQHGAKDQRRRGRG